MLQKINSEISLRAAIVQLEIRQADEGKLLKAQFYVAYESIKPINLIISTLREAAESQELKNNLLNTVIGFGTGYLSKILFQGFTKNPVKKLFGTALEFGVTNVVAKNPELIKALGSGLLNIIRKPRNPEYKVSQKAGRGRLDLI